jgi:pimeloyl-ACP methyl ester carboxylesterase
VRVAASTLLSCICFAVQAQQSRVVDIPTRPGVTQRFLYVAPAKPKAAAVLFAGGHGDLEIDSSGRLARLKGNFLVRSRDLFAEQSIAVAVVAPPSDRRDLSGFRQTREHVEDTRVVIAWLRKETGVPVWLIGTSRGTQSAGFIATQLPRGEGGPDGVVLTSTVLTSTNPRDRPVPEMPLGRVAVPVLVVHHRQDSCRVTSFADVSRLTSRLGASPRTELIAVEGGVSQGDPCEAFAYHGYNGIERDVVEKIAGWMLR